MPDLGSDGTIRLAAFAAAFAFMALIEAVRPRRKPHPLRLRRWLTNVTIGGLGAALLRVMAALALPLAALAAAALAEQRGWGVLARLDWPWWIELFIAVIVLDFAIWLQHWLSHRIPLLWRLHRVHHADVDFDVTTALRFHPFEIGLSMLYKIVWVLALGPSVPAVLVFEVMLNVCAVFNHANARLPVALDRALRLVLVTPDMHRVHHSVERGEHNTNFGFNLAFWDRLFGTYTAEPAAGHEGMTIGLAPYQSDRPSELGWSLALPMRRERKTH